MRVIGTAGHIDHGKSSLVKALTGTDPDRLPEEKARGMTIELGFALLDLGDQTAGMIDVPGHERFIRHMLAGAGGIDLALLVVAADEAVMPQTREHLAILDLLDVRHGVVALTKCDLVDAEWIALATDEVRVALAGSTLADSPIVPCSSVTGQGLAELRTTLSHALAGTPERADRGRPHLPVDRVFTRSGYGTVVTGTLLDGTLSLGQEVEFAPGGPRGRIRGLQSHQHTLERATPGRRVAVNVAGVALEDIARGMVLCLPGDVPTAQHLDLRIRAVGDAERIGKAHGEQEHEVTHNMPIVLHTGAAEAHGRLRLLDAESLGPREEGWAQVRLDTPIAALRGDRCVLRVPSPAATVAGGVIVAVNPPRHRRFAARVLQRLEALATATPEERILDVLGAGPATAIMLAERADLQQARIEASLATLAGSGQVVALGRNATGTGDAPAAMKGYWTTPTWLAEATRRALDALEDYHRRYPLRTGMAGEALREALGIERRPWGDLLDAWRSEDIVQVRNDQVATRGHTVTLNADQERRRAALLARLDEQPYAPSAQAEADAIDPELLAALLEQGDPVRLAEGILLRRAAYREMRQAALDMIDTEGGVTVGMLRDRFGTSRKFALALLEHLDDLRLTRRLGDGRVRGPAGSG